MKPPLPRHGRILLLFALAATAACSHGHRHHIAAPVQVFREVEPNDAVNEANDFGVLLPGDHFFIDGWTTDSGADPFDGFQFVAGEPIHVDFRLHHADPSTDFDVCLFDPQLNLTVACFATPDLPETGGVDVAGSGLAFQLVVESFLGAGGYSLEIEVVSLGAAFRANGANGALVPRGETTTLAPGRAPEMARYAAPTTRRVEHWTDPSDGSVHERIIREGS